MYAVQDIATEHTWLLKFKLIKIQKHLNFSLLVALVTFQVLISCRGQEATILDRAETEYFHYYSNCSWMLLD